MLLLFLVQEPLDPESLVRRSLQPGARRSQPTPQAGGDKERRGVSFRFLREDFQRMDGTVFNERRPLGWQMAIKVTSASKTLLLGGKARYMRTCNDVWFVHEAHRTAMVTTDRADR